MNEFIVTVVLLFAAFGLWTVLWSGILWIITAKRELAELRQLRAWRKESEK